jgi:DNA-binding transcriptional ArsR family regulator
MEIKTAIGALAALAHDSRLAIFRLLVQEGAAGIPAGRIAEHLGISSPTLSFHLGELAAAGLVQSRREGRSIIYAADYGAMNDLIAYLTENCCRGHSAARDSAICKPASPARKRRRGDSSDEAPARLARR